MADDVINGLENMKLTVDEEEVIEITEEGRREEIESCNLSLIGKFLTCKAFNKMAAKNTIRRAWGLENQLHILEVGPNLFQFKFNSEFDMSRVLRGGPWTFDNQLLMIKRWRKGMTATNIKWDTASIWVQIWGAPFDMISPVVAERIGSRLGVVEEVEKRRRQEEQNLFMRVRIALPITKPLRRGGYIAGTDGERTWVTYKYERLPMFCHFCGLLGHDIRHCADHFAAEKDCGEIEYQYGDWLKASGNRLRTSQRQDMKQTSGDYGGVMNEQEPVTAAPAMTTEITKGNPKESINNGIKRSEISGCSPKKQQPNHDSNGINGALNGSVTQKSEAEVSSKITTLSEEVHVATLPTLNADELAAKTDDGNEHEQGLNGLTIPKPKSTWVRRIRMDCGPGGPSRVPGIQTLGKRESMQGPYEETDGQSMKRGKVEDTAEKSNVLSAGVDRHPCREQ